MDPRHRIQLAGRVSVFRDRTEIALSLKRSLATVVILALSAAGGVSRDRIIALLWGDSDQATARNSLRQTLHRLRQDLGPSASDLLEIGPEVIALRSVTVDVTEALAEAREGRPPPLLASQPQALLEAAMGLDHIDPSFANWIAVQRQRLHEDAMSALTDALATSDPPDPAGVAIARLLLRMEPVHEGACRYLMQTHHLTGNVAEALSVYNALWKRLDEEFDTPPSEATQDLVVKIKQSADLAPGADERSAPRLDPARPEAGGDPARQPPVLWVRPFDITHLEDTLRLRAAGLRSDMIAAFCRFREWRVVDAAVGAPEPAPSDIAPIYVLSGNAVEQGAGLAFVLTFRELVSGQVIWSERLGIGDEPWGRAQRRAVRRIAAALSLHLSTNRFSRFGLMMGPGLPAYDAWILGQALLNHWRPDSEDRAERLFRDIIAGQSDFAPAYVGLAQVLNTRHLIRPGMLRSLAAHREARRLSLHAVTLDPLDAKAQLALGWSLALNGVWESAVESFRLAHDLNDNDPWVLASSALGFAYCGRLADALPLADQMAEIGIGLTPLHWAYHTGVRFFAGDYRQAARAAELAAGATAYIDAWHGAALAKSGQTGAARDVLRGFFDDTRRQWHGAAMPTDAAVAGWILQCHPIRDEGAWAALRDGLAAAGAPVPDHRPVIGR